MLLLDLNPRQVSTNLNPHTTLLLKQLEQGCGAEKDTLRQVQCAGNRQLQGVDESVTPRLQAGPLKPQTSNLELNFDLHFEFYFELHSTLHAD